MLITLEVLEEENACSRGVKYFQSLEKKEWGVVELIKRCYKDSKESYAGWLYRCIDSNDELREILGYLIETKGHLDAYVFIYCSELFKNDLELFEGAVRYQMKNGWDLGDALDVSQFGELLKQLPELYEEAKLYQEEFWKKLCKM